MRNSFLAVLHLLSALLILAATSTVRAETPQVASLRLGAASTSFSAGNTILARSPDLPSVSILYSPESDIWKAQSWTTLTPDAVRVLRSGADPVIAIDSFGGKPVHVRLSARASGQELTWTMSLVNRSPGTVVGVSGPALRGMMDRPEGTLYFPDRPGQKLPDPWKALQGEAFHLPYPVPASMQYVTYAGADGGAAYHVLDRQMVYKEFVFGGPEREISVIQYPFVAAGQRWTSPPIVWQALRQDWHEAARFYQRWFRSWASRPRISPQVRAMPVMAGIVVRSRPVDDTNVRDVLKNQETGTYAAALEKAKALHEDGFQGAHLVGWFGRGHDTTYPDFIPSPAMGGLSQFHALVDGMHRLGMLVTLYLNARLANVNSPTFLAHPDWALVLPHNERMHEGYGDQQFVVLCPDSTGFEGHLLATIRTAAGEYHADGVQMDQIGAAGSGLCFNREHGHRTPATAWAEGYLKWLQVDQREARALRPTFWNWIEGAWEGAGQYVDLSQGGFWQGMPGAVYFPELYHYTLPEHPLFGDASMGGVPYWCPTDIHRAMRINAVASPLFWDGDFMDNIGLTAEPPAPVHWFRKGRQAVLTVKNDSAASLDTTLSLSLAQTGQHGLPRSARALAAGVPVRVRLDDGNVTCPVDVPAGQVEAVMLTW